MHLTRFLNYNVHGTAAAADQPATRDTTTYTGANPFEPQLGDVFVTNSRGRGLYRGATFGVRKRFSQRYQLEANYVLAKDEDDDSNERDPFTDRSFNFYDLSLDYGPSDRDIRHKFNFFTYAELPQRLLRQRPRSQGRTAQPITTSPRVLNGTDRGRNWDRKDNEYFSLDWRLQRPFRLGGRGADHPEPRDVQHVQQRQQHQSAHDAGAVQLRRVPAAGRRRSAAGAARGEGDVLR